MNSLKDVAARFFEACETGKGWAVCSDLCHADATFTAQAPALAEIKTVEAYTEWLKGLYTFVSPATYDLEAFAVDDERGTVISYAVFHGTHSGQGGPLPPTNKSCATDYCYVMKFEAGRLRSMTKVWNDGFALKQLGWA